MADEFASPILTVSTEMRMERAAGPLIYYSVLRRSDGFASPLICYQTPSELGAQRAIFPRRGQRALPFPFRLRFPGTGD